MTSRPTPVFVLAGPSGSGKDTVIRKMVELYPAIERAVNFVTRQKREGEKDGDQYTFITNEEFLAKLNAGEIPEHYYREKINAYYGVSLQDIKERLARGKIVAVQAQISGARYLKEVFNALTIFIEPTLSSDFEARMRERSPMSDSEWQERLEYTRREITQEVSEYDYKIINEDGKLDEAVEALAAILSKEGFVLH